MPTKILVVDDEEKIRETLRGVLSDEGYEVADAGDGRAALEQLKQGHPDLVILDVWLPEIDGITLLEEIKRLQPDLPVIIICGHANIEAAVRATRLGAADFIEKPYYQGAAGESTIQSDKRLARELLASKVKLKSGTSKADKLIFGHDLDNSEADDACATEGKLTGPPPAPHGPPPSPGARM